MTKRHLFFVMLFGGLRLCAAAEQKALIAVHEQYPPENPYLFVSTVHRNDQSSSLPQVTIDHAIRDFDQGVLIAMLECRGAKEWTGKANLLLQAIDTDVLHREIQQGIKDPHSGRYNGVQHGVLSVLNTTLNRYRDIFNKALFAEEYLEDNGDPELFTGQLFDKQLQRYSVLATMLVGMRCGDWVFSVQCTSHNSAKYFINFIYGDSSIHWMVRCPRVLDSAPQTQQYIKGIHIPEELSGIVRAQACENAAVATKTLVHRAMCDGWLIDGVKRPTVLCVGSELCALLRSKNAKDCAEENAS